MAYSDANNTDKLIHLFRLIVTNHYSALKEVDDTFDQDQDLLKRKLEFPCGNTWEYCITECACVLNHEKFTYISGRNVDRNTLDDILKSVKCGKCSHSGSIPQEDEDTGAYSGEVSGGPEQTSVNLIHAAAAIGYTDVLEILLKLERKNPSLIGTMGLTCLHLAILHKHQSCIRTIIDTLPYLLERYCKDYSHWHITNCNPSLIVHEEISTLELSVLMENSLTAKEILETTSLGENWVTAYRSMKATKLLLSYWENSIVNHLSVRCVELLLQDLIVLGRSKEIGALLDSVTKKGWTNIGEHLVLLAVVFDSPDILSLILNSGADKGDLIIRGRTLLDIAIMLGHKKCATLLKENKIMESTHTILI